MQERGGVSCSHYFSCFTFMVETIIYLVNLKVASKTTKCRDFIVIFPFFQKCTVILPIFYRDFLTALSITHVHSNGEIYKRRF